MRTLFSLLVVLLATTCLWAYDFKSGDLYYNITSNSAPYTVEVTYEDEDRDNNYHDLTVANIPETVIHNGVTYTVTSIGASAFYFAPITSVSIPNSVITIKGWAFSGACLESIIIPNSVTTIGVRAFGNIEGCHGLRSVVIGKNVATIGYGAFCYQPYIASITCLAETPPILDSNVFNDPEYDWVDHVSPEIPIYISSCASVELYRNSSWNYFKNIQGPAAEYSISVMSTDDIMGNAIVDRNDSCGNQISATANYGYHFVRWSDGYTDNPRSLELTQDTVLTAEFAINNYTISAQCNYTERGTTSGDITAAYLDYVTISASANYGYHFSCWDDYNYDNPRQVQVTEDKIYTAYFDKNTYSITKNYDSNQGYVDGYSSGEYLDNITLTAEPNYGYRFVRWSDGETDNPRHFVLTQDTTFSAEFAQTFSGQCGDNMYWSYQNNTLTISGFGEMYNERPWGLFVNEIKTVVLPNGITHIGNDAFSDCGGLTEISIPASVTSIGKTAFAGCKKLVQIDCHPLTPPTAESTSFANYNVYLNVPCDCLQTYQLDVVFGSFKYIQCLDGDESSVEDVVLNDKSNIQKLLQNGQLLIIRNGNTYNVMGQEL